MTENAKHTPTPWCVLPGVPDGGGIGIGPEIEGIGPHAIVTFNGGSSEANAAFIVRAVNAHDDLVAALRDLQAACISLMDEVTGKRAADWGLVNDAMVTASRLAPRIGIGHVLGEGHDKATCPECARAALAKVQP